MLDDGKVDHSFNLSPSHSCAVKRDGPTDSENEKNGYGKASCRWDEYTNLVAGPPHLPATKWMDPMD